MFINKQINDYANIFSAINNDNNDLCVAFATDDKTVQYYANQIMAINDCHEDWAIDEDIAYEISYALAKAMLHKHS